MDILKMQRKLPKEQLTRLVENEHGLEVRVHHSHTPMVTFLIVTKELKHDYKGYLGRCSREEYESGHLGQVAWDFLNAPEQLPAEVAAMLTDKEVQ